MNPLIKFFVGFGTILILTSCAVVPAGRFFPENVPPIPDYANPLLWAAHPMYRDSADVVPDPSMTDQQDNARADVFYLYPTTYIGKRGQRSWNADVYDESLNRHTDRKAIRNQASVFNGACKVYAPRYRQAHLEAFYTRRRDADAQQALELAYQDVKSAFAYYLEHWNQGRPLIIAAHSQGTYHAARLIREVYENGTDMPPMIAAYLIGMPVLGDHFVRLPPCQTAVDTHCFCSWRTVNARYRPNRAYPTGDMFAVINPVTWTTDKSMTSRMLHQGAVLKRFYDGVYPGTGGCVDRRRALAGEQTKDTGSPFPAHEKLSHCRLQFLLCQSQAECRRSRRGLFSWSYTE